MMMVWLGGSEAAHTRALHSAVRGRAASRVKCPESGTKIEKSVPQAKIDLVGRPLVSFLEVPAMSLPPNFR
jgi:hypothetical protein